MNIDEPIISTSTNTNTNTNEVIKKKRGRKPKSITENQSSIIIDQAITGANEETTSETTSETSESDFQKEEESCENETTAKTPKKRGRKPKGGKIIVNSLLEEMEIIHEPNIILHLKCKFSDLDSSTLTYDCKDIDSFQFEKNKGAELGYHIINNASDILENTNKNNNNNNSNNNTQNDHELKNICNKIKTMSYNLQSNNISDKKSDCFWCTCSFDNPPIYIPKHRINNTYQCYGCFCSPECAAAFLFKESIDTSTRFERYYLLNHIYNKVYNYTKNIKPAPDPYYTLNKYYGSLTIQEYRRLFKSERLLIVVDKPLSRILPELHEFNDDIMLNDNLQNIGKFKIKRKTKQNKTDILNETFNVQ